MKSVYMQLILFIGLSVVDLVDHATCVETYLWGLISNTSRVGRQWGQYVLRNPISHAWLNVLTRITF